MLLALKTRQIARNVMASTIKPEFWSWENEYDNAQLITKRIVYAFHLWIFRMTAEGALMSFLTFLIGAPILAMAIVMMRKIHVKISRKNQYWSNRTQLNQDVKAKLKVLEDKMKSQEAKMESRIEKEVRQQLQNL